MQVSKIRLVKERSDNTKSELHIKRERKTSIGDGDDGRLVLRQKRTLE